MSLSKDIAVRAERIATASNELAGLIAGAPIGEAKKPKASTTATAKYQDKAGIAARTYKLKAADADAFKAACETSGESQAAVLSRLMAAYIAGEGKPCWFCRLKARFTKGRKEVTA